MLSRDIFEDLFVLEMTNNHQGNLARGLEIVHDHSRVVRFANVRAAIKLQFRHLDSFIHKDFIARSDIRYIKRILDTQLSKHEYAELIETIRRSGCIPMATPFDESSVDWCVEFELPIIKVASADCNDWLLLERVAKTRKPVIVSTGGVSLKDLDDIVTFFEGRNIPLALNHCVAAYPTDDNEMELNQIDFLKLRYPNHSIGLSSHDWHDIVPTMHIACGKGVRLFERHIDIDADGFTMAPYSSSPQEIDRWFKAHRKATELLGTSESHRRFPISKEIDYLDSYVRGVYARRVLEAGDTLAEEDIYLAIPLQKGQLSTRELMLGRYGHRMTVRCERDAPVTVDMIDTPYAENEELKRTIASRGL